MTRLKTLNCILCDDDDMAPGRRYCKSCHRNRVTHERSKKREKMRAQYKEYYETNHDKLRENAVWYRLKVRYGVTKEEYLAMQESQNSLCAICQQPCKTNQRLVVDHCHKTGVVRGLLCKSCNMHLGVLEKDEWMEKALGYLGLQQ